MVTATTCKISIQQMTFFFSAAVGLLFAVGCPNCVAVPTWLSAVYLYSCVTDRCCSCGCGCGCYGLGQPAIRCSDFIPPWGGKIVPNIISLQTIRNSQDDAWICMMCTLHTLCASSFNISPGYQLSSIRKKKLKLLDFGLSLTASRSSTSFSQFLLSASTPSASLLSAILLHLLLSTRLFPTSSLLLLHPREVDQILNDPTT